MEYAVAVRRGGRALADGDAPLELHEAWTPEHLVLLALAQCSLASLRYHGGRASIEVAAEATASGSVGQRDDGSWGFFELECCVEASLHPPQAGDALRELLRKAERGCFVGASLEPKPRYDWRIDGAQVA